jgi:hypothetical protein
MNRLRLRKFWVTATNLFWIAVWLPGLVQDVHAKHMPRVEDILTVTVLFSGILFELLDVRFAVFVNVWFYLVYSLVPICVYLRDTADVHAAFGIVFISIPYILVGLVNLWWRRL